MTTLLIEYLNPDSQQNGSRYFVREDKDLPHHYLRIGDLHETGDGRLLKKYCKIIGKEEVNND